MQMQQSAWLGRFQIFKPRVGQKVGIPFQPWFHYAIFDDYVLTYVWDSREVIDVYKIKDLKQTNDVADFDTVSFLDNGKYLVIGSNSSEYAKEVVTKLAEENDDLPINLSGKRETIADVRLQAEKLTKNATLPFEVYNDFSIALLDSHIDFASPMMFSKASTFNPSKQKYADANAYQGRSKYAAIIARYTVLKQLADSLV